MLFVDEAPLPRPVEGASGFAERFAAQGPKDSQGRSLRDLTCSGGLLRYPCSYMIYSPRRSTADARPRRTRSTRGCRTCCRAGGAAPLHARLTGRDRQAIIQILQETKKDLPASSRRLTRVALR